MAEQVGDEPLPSLAAREAGHITAGLTGLDASTDPFAAAVRATRTPMILTDPRQADNPIVFANDAFCRKTGYPREEVLGRNCRFLQGPETDAAAVERIRTAVDAGVPIEIELRNYRKNGEAFWNRLLIAPVHDAGGRLAFFFANQIDVTHEHDRLAALEQYKVTLERQVAERTAALQASALRLRALFETSLQFQGLLTPDCRLLDANAALLEAIGAKLEDVAGKLFWETPWFTGTPGMPEAARAAILSALEGHVVRQDIEVTLPTGARAFDFAVRLVRDGHGAVIAIIPEAVEITERRRAEAALRQAQKMEAIGLLTGGIAHDFNNMLQSVASGLELAQRRLDRDQVADAAVFMGMARKGVDRAAALTRRLLAFSRRQQLNPKPVVVDELVLSLVELIKGTIGPTIAIEVQLHDGNWPVLCDPNQFENALLNLTINARDAMPQGGTVTLCTQDVCITPADLLGEDAAATGDYVQISVSDTGVGMEPGVLDRVLEPFYTTKPLGQGTGLGLSQVYGFVRQSSGLLRLESTPGQGTTVRILMPRHHGALSAPIAPAAMLQQEHPGAGQTVLLVEDEAFARAMAAEALRDKGYTVLEAGDGSACLRLLANDAPLDMLVTDVGLPGALNGRQLADAVRERHPKLPVLFITGYAGGVLDGQLATRMDVVSKPYRLDFLISKVADMLEAVAGD